MGWCPHGQARKTCSLCAADLPRTRSELLVELVFDQARQHRKWKTDGTKKAFEVALPPTGIAFMFSDKRRIQYTRAEFEKLLNILIAEMDRGAVLRLELLKDEATAGPILTLFRRALQAE